MTTEVKYLTAIAIVCLIAGAVAFVGAVRLVGLARGDVTFDAGPGSLSGSQPARIYDVNEPGSGVPCIDMDGLAGPAPCISDPIKQAGPSLDTVAAARKLGWPVVLGTVLFFGLVLLGKRVPWLSVGKRALFISGATTVLAACCNTAFDGGTPWAVAFAGAGVLLKLVQGDRSLARPGIGRERP
jgi:hypothetical protein